MSNRQLKEGVLKEIVKYCEPTEIPSIFALWTGIISVSAALRRDAFIDLGYFTVYPNLYVVLVAGSARCRKSTSIRVAYNFIKSVRPSIKIMSQKMTTEALIGSLAGFNTKDDNTVVKSAEGIAIVDELATLVDKNAFASGMVQVLTKLYDCDDFPYETRARGVEMIQNPCLTLFGGSTLHWIKECIPPVAIGGGFTSRVVFVYRDAIEKVVAWPSITEENKKRFDMIVHDLNEISKIRGSFALDDKAKKLYEDEYNDFKLNNELFDNPNLTGYAGRRHVTLLKLSMIVSASEKDSRLITEDDMAIAIKILKNAEVHMPYVLAQISSGPTGDVCEELLSIIKRRKFIDRKSLINKMKHKLTSREISVLLETLIEAGVVRFEDKGSEVIYYYTGKD